MRWQHKSPLCRIFSVPFQIGERKKGEYTVGDTDTHHMDGHLPFILYVLKYNEPATLHPIAKEMIYINHAIHDILKSHDNH